MKYTSTGKKINKLISQPNILSYYSSWWFLYLINFFKSISNNPTEKSAMYISLQLNWALTILLVKLTGYEDKSRMSCHVMYSKATIVGHS